MKKWVIIVVVIVLIVVAFLYKSWGTFSVENVEWDNGANGFAVIKYNFKSYTIEAPSDFATKPTPKKIGNYLVCWINANRFVVTTLDGSKIVQEFNKD